MLSYLFLFLKGIRFIEWLVNLYIIRNNRMPACFINLQRKNWTLQNLHIDVKINNLCPVDGLYSYIIRLLWKTYLMFVMLAIFLRGFSSKIFMRIDRPKSLFYIFYLSSANDMRQRMIFFCRATRIVLFVTFPAKKLNDVNWQMTYLKLKFHTC